MPNHRRIFALSTALLFAATAEGHSQTAAANPVSALQWRMIGPHRAGRTVGATGVRQQPNVFYIGVNNGGVWKTTDYGRTWFPIFDDQATSSIGDIVVAPSDPNVIYVGTGEGLQRPDLSTGDGVYKSTDAGKTWRHLPGLRDAQQLGGLAVDPHNPNRVFVAALGHPYGPNEERGVYRSMDGGETWQRVLYKDENTGAIQVTLDPNNPDVVYADLWAGRQGPWENATWDGPLSGLYKSVDGGNTWTQLTNGLPNPEQGLGRIGFGIAPSDSRRLYATVDAGAKGGIYRSDDGGASWTNINPDPRLWGRGSDFAEIKVDPRNADIVYSANVVTWKSTDGGKSWKGWKGAPGGDDYHRIWINPDNPSIILLGVDQGGTLTVNGGDTWSSWYNQPTAQFYHVITDNRVPYRVYGSQQESGSVGIASRGDYGQITFADWNPIGSEEYGYVAPDPLNPDILYGGKISRFDQRTREVQNISPAPGGRGKYRFLRTAPIIFSHVDPHVLYFAGNVLFKTTTGGHNWDVISPDLTRVDYDVPQSYGMYTGGNLSRAKNRGVIYSVGPSFLNVNTIWTGSDDGYIQLTRDGGATWKNVTPAVMTPWSKVAQIEASHFDDNTAYAAINRFKLDDLRPHIYRTHDGGTTWQETVSGIPSNEIVNAVREDPIRKGLLFAGTERAVYFSLDDGDHWQSLRDNMPATSIRDLV
ncbi:MAG: glycoside hydrolase, partial [Gemmatimonadota bacterium]|nr:glycoside hydrolase [Gemmatimonadota bacterium]